jgi:hypothetical protein
MAKNIIWIEDKAFDELNKEGPLINGYHTSSYIFMPKRLLKEFGDSEPFDDRWFKRTLELQKIRDELINNNAKMRAALLIIKEHKSPYVGFSFDYGSNGVRDHFIGIASKALED